MRAVLHELARLGSATVYEASGQEGLLDVELKQIVPGSRVAGPAHTVRCGQDDNLTAHEALSDVRPGEVVVLTMPEPRPVALIGGLMATSFKAQGAAAVLVDAAVRDVEELAAIGLPIWARWVRIRGAAKDVAGTRREPVAVGGTTIADGDIVVLDADGGAVIARSRVDAVLAASRARVRKEALNVDQLAAGALTLDLYGLRAPPAAPAAG